MKTKKTKQSRYLRNIICEIFLYKNITRICVAKTYSDHTIEEEEKFTNESIDKLTTNLSNMTSKTIGITIFNFKQHCYYK